MGFAAWIAAAAFAGLGIAGGALHHLMLGGTVPQFLWLSSPFTIAAAVGISAASATNHIWFALGLTIAIALTLVATNLLNLGGLAGAL